MALVLPPLLIRRPYGRWPGDKAQSDLDFVFDPSCLNASHDTSLWMRPPGHTPLVSPIRSHVIAQCPPHGESRVEVLRVGFREFVRPGPMSVLCLRPRLLRSPSPSEASRAVAARVSCQRFSAAPFSQKSFLELIVPSAPSVQRDPTNRP